MAYNSPTAPNLASFSAVSSKSGCSGALCSSAVIMNDQSVQEHWQNFCMSTNVTVVQVIE